MKKETRMGLEAKECADSRTFKQGRQMGIGVGLALGVALGVALGNVGAGLAFGLVFGVALGPALPGKEIAKSQSNVNK